MFCSVLQDCSSLKPPLVVTFSFVLWQWKKENVLLGGSSGVVNSFTKKFKQNGIVVWPGEKKEAK